MSGRRTAGSSVGRSMNTISDPEPARSRIHVARSSMEISFGLPMFIGPEWSVAAKRRMPSTRSST